MHTLYNSDSFVVVSFDLPAGDRGGDSADPAPLQRGGFELIDKQARKEIFIEGALAEQFHQGVQALVAERPGSDADTLHAVIDDFIAGYAALAQQPVLLH
jgi:hypothetical protein